LTLSSENVLIRATVPFAKMIKSSINLFSFEKLKRLKTKDLLCFGEMIQLTKAWLMVASADS
jgi:hypothetical protein